MSDPQHPAPQHPEPPVPPIDPPSVYGPAPTPQYPYGAPPSSQYPFGAAPAPQYPYGGAQAPLTPGQTFAPPGTQPPTGAQPPTRSGLGLASLIVGGVAFLLAFVPFVNYISGIIALVGVVLGIVALVQKYRRKGLAIAGLIVSVVAVILSIALAITYTVAFVNATQDAIDESLATDDPIPEIFPENPFGEGGPAAGEVGSLENPAAIGTTIELTDSFGPEWEVTPGTPTLDAGALVAAEDEYNQVAPPGSQFALLPITVKYVGTSTGTPAVIAVDFVTEAGSTHGVFDTYVTVPDDLIEIDDLEPGAEATGNVVIAVPSEGIENGTWRISSIFGAEYYFAAQ